MRRWLAIAKATALEMLSEPLSLLLMLMALAISTLAPAFHYHQFGEADRLARDAGFSALFTCGSVFAVFGVLKSFRREIESFTIQMALSHPVSRTEFFLSKIAGAFLAYLIFFVIIAANAVIITRGAEIGGEIAGENGDIARLWAPSFAIGIAAMLLPLVVSAILNRFCRFRFVLTVFVLAFVFVLGGVGYRLSFPLALRLLSVMLLIIPLSVVMMSAAAAVSCFGIGVAASSVGVLFLAMLPIIGNYYLPEALARGGCVDLRYVVMALMASLPAVAAFLILGVVFFNGRDIVYE